MSLKSDRFGDFSVIQSLFLSRSPPGTQKEEGAPEDKAGSGPGMAEGIPATGSWHPKEHAAGDVTQWVKERVTKPDDLSLNFKLSPSLFVCHGTRMFPAAHRQDKQKFN